MFETATELVLAGVVSAAAYLLGRGKRNKSLTDQTQPICGCSHHLSMHNDKNGCNAFIDSWKTVHCPCQKYVGPTPIDAFSMTPVVFKDS